MRPICSPSSNKLKYAAKGWSPSWNRRLCNGMGLARALSSTSLPSLSWCLIWNGNNGLPHETPPKRRRWGPAGRAGGRWSWIGAAVAKSNQRVTSINPLSLSHLSSIPLHFVSWSASFGSFSSTQYPSDIYIYIYRNDGYFCWTRYYILILRASFTLFLFLFLYFFFLPFCTRRLPSLPLARQQRTQKEQSLSVSSVSSLCLFVIVRT